MTLEKAKELFEKASDNAINYHDSTDVISIDSVNIILNEMYNHFESRKCSNCLHYGLDQCLLYHECELSGGECGKGFIEIDNPEEHYCADYEDRIK